MLACHAANPISIPKTDNFRSLNYESLCASVPWAGKRCISVKMLLGCCWTLALVSTLNEPLHNKTNNMTCAPLKTDQTWAHWSFCCGAAQISNCQSVLLHAKQQSWKREIIQSQSNIYRILPKVNKVIYTIDTFCIPNIMTLAQAVHSCNLLLNSDEFWT